MDVLWVILTLLVAAGVGWPVTIGVLKLARSVDEHETADEYETADEHETADGHAAPRSSATRAPEIVIPAPPAREPTTPSQPAPRPGVLRGGLVIGILERLGVAGAILANEPVAIAYVVAIKGLGRYAELKETPAVAERFIIGTLTSLLWAAAVAASAAVYLL